MIRVQRQLGYVRNTANQYCGMNDKLDQMKTSEDKKKMMSFLIPSQLTATFLAISESLIQENAAALFFGRYQESRLTRISWMISLISHGFKISSQSGTS